MLKWIWIVIVILIIVVGILKYNNKLNFDLFTERTTGGGIHIVSSRKHPLVFVSSPPGFSNIKISPKGWKTTPADDKKISKTLQSNPTIVFGTELREDKIYEKPDLHIHLGPVEWELSNPLDLSQKRSILEQNGIDFEKYWDNLGHMDIDVVIKYNKSLKNNVKKQILEYLKELQTIRAGLIVV